MQVNNSDDPFQHIANMIESGDDYAAFAPSAPHPALTGEPQGGLADDEDVVPPDDQVPDDADQLPRETIERCSLEPQNDTGNGQRLLAWFGDDILSVRDVGWHAWDGKRWTREGGQQTAILMAQKVAERIVLEADVMAATPNEQRLLDAASDARDTLAAMEKEGEPKDGGDKQRRQMLIGLIKRGDEVRDAINGRKVARRKYSVSSGNAGKIRGMIDQAEPHRSVEIGHLDADKMAFNVQNGTLYFVCDEVPDPDASDHAGAMIKRWRVELRPHAREDRITKIAPVDYDKAARCPRFMEAVQKFQPIESVRSFLQRYHGYGLTGLTGEQCLVFNYGTGSNWKSTFTEVVARIMGDYCATIAFESLAGDTQKSGSQASPDIARLPGARLVRASEPERGVQFKEALIKSLTGGEPMLTRHNFKDFFEFRPDFKLTLSGNHKPEIGGVDHGIWRRIRFVPWPVTIPDSQKRPMDEVLAELWAERSGILNWLLAGCLDYLNHGLRTPQEVIDATAAYREEMDPVGSFLNDCVTMVPANSDGSAASVVSARDMYDAFSAWGWQNGVRPWKEKGFATAMSQKGFLKERRNAGRVYLHVRLHDVPKGKPRGEQPPHPADEEVPL